jgi:hypothetical protein
MLKEAVVNDDPILNLQVTQAKRPEILVIYHLGNFRRLKEE